MEANKYQRGGSLSTQKSEYYYQLIYTQKSEYYYQLIYTKI